MAVFSFLGPFRSALRARFFNFLRQVHATDDGRRLLADSLTGTGCRREAYAAAAWAAPVQPYPDIGPHRRTMQASIAPVFITARFRTGSTLLWNLFRHVPGCTAFYEPLNERRWFDPTSRGLHVDRSHGVEDYWREYTGLDDLSRWYQQRWIDRQLYMDRFSWDPNLFEYIGALIRAAPQRAVLQFNRVDFRLGWLRHHFPSARLLHLYRHPREQWCSTLMGSSFPITGTVDEFEPHDQFYLLSWARDLAYQFPFLDLRIVRHPYELFYLIWKLSWSFGIRYSDASFSYEQLCEQPERELPRLMEAAQVKAYDSVALRRLIGPIPKSRSLTYASDDWFKEQELRAETLLSRVLDCGDHSSRTAATADARHQTVHPADVLVA